MDEIPSFGAWLRRRRKALDLTQEALAHRVGYSVSAIRKLEADEYRPSREIAEHLADALGIAPAERAAFVHFARVGLDAEATSVCFPAAAPPTPSAPPRAPAVVPPSTTHLTHPSNLPPQPTPFVGRDEELALIATHLHNPACRLVTVIGPGGSGKTRLALEAAGAWRPDFPDGVYFVPLAALSSGSLLASTIADTLAFPLYDGADESDQAHDRHCGYYLALLQHTSEDELAGRLQDVLPKIEEDLGNVRTAYRWAVAHDKLEEIGMSLGGLYHFYSMRSLFREGLDVFEHAVELLRSTSERAAPDAGRAAQRAAIIAYALTLQGWFYLFRGLFDQARDRAQESAAWLRSTNARPERAGNLLLQGFIAVMLGPYEQAKQSLWECIAITSETGQRLIRATALQGLGMACMALEDNAEARQRLRESLVIFQAIGIPWGTAMCLQFLGDVARAQAEYAEAKQRYQESLTVRTDWGDRWGMGIALGRLGSLARTIGAYEDAQQRYQESLAIFTTLSHRLGMAIALGNLGRVAFAQGKVAEAHHLHQESLALSRAIGNKRSIGISLNQLGMVHHALGDYRAGQHAFDEALTAALESGMMPLALEVLVGLAALVAQAGAAERAIELLALALQHPAGTQRTRDRAERLLAELSSGLPPDIVAAAQERGRQRDLRAMRQELLGELEAAGWGGAHGAALTSPTH